MDPREGDTCIHTIIIHNNLFFDLQHIMSTTEQTSGIKAERIDSLLDSILVILNQEAEQEEQEHETCEHHSNNKASYLSISIIDHAHDIPKNEIELLKETALIREEALTLLRQNQIADGTALLAKSNHIQSNHHLNHEAKLLFETFQAAADSFLSLKKGAYKESMRLMENALKTHQELYLEYQYPIQVRRIHLARNCTRIMSMERRYEAAFEYSTQLILHTLSAAYEWPMSVCQLKITDSISASSQLFVINQLLNEIVFILEQHPSPAILLRFRTFIQCLNQIGTSESQLVLDWASAYQAHKENDDIRFLEHTTSFLKHHQNRLPVVYPFIVNTLIEQYFEA